jgi:flagellar hook-associated protein 3
MSGISSIYNDVCSAVSIQTQTMSKLQEQVSTGSKINRTSDDSSAAYQLLSLNTQKSSLGNYIDNLSNVINTLEYSSTVVQDMASSITRAQTLLTQVISGTYNQDARNLTADGINEILEQMVALANTQYSGKSLFGGSNTSSLPYLVERADGEITKVTYQGSSENRLVELAGGLSFPVLQVGRDIFSLNDRQDPEFYGQTGAARGTGTSSVRGDIWLQVTGSAGSYSLSIDGGLSWVTTDGADTNLAVTNSQTGEVLYVDATGITSAGTDIVRTPGTYDLFNALISIRDILRNEQNFSDAQFSDLQESTVSLLEDINGLLTLNEEDVGSKLQLLDTLKTNLENQQNNVEDRISLLQDADISQIAIDLTRVETLYQLSLSVAGKLLSVSLLDYLD